MLSNLLNANQVKKSDGTSVNFQRIDQSGRKTVFAQVGENPSLPFRFQISHQEIGTGMKRRIRSAFRVDKTVVSSVDNVTRVTPLGYVVLDTPIGALTTMDEPKNVLAALIQMLASTGANQTIVLDGTSTAGAALLEGSL